MEVNRPGYYAIIPADVRYDDQIPANAKLLYGEVAALIGRDGYCFASNQYFSEVFGFSVTSVTRLLSKLEERGYIVRTLIKDKEGKVEQRRMYLSVSVPDVQPPTNFEGTPHQNCGYPPLKIGEDTNTSNTDIEKENKKRKAKRESLDDAQLKDHWVNWITDIAGPDWTSTGKNDLYLAVMAFYEPRETKKQEPARTVAACTRLGNLLVQYGNGSPTEMIQMLDRATASGWKSVYPRNPAAASVSRIEKQGGEADRWL